MVESPSVITIFFNSSQATFEALLNNICFISLQTGQLVQIFNQRTKNQVVSAGHLFLRVLGHLIICGVAIYMDMHIKKSCLSQRDSSYLCVVHICDNHIPFSLGMCGWQNIVTLCLLSSQGKGRDTSARPQYCEGQKTPHFIILDTSDVRTSIEQICIHTMHCKELWLLVSNLFYPKVFLHFFILINFHCKFSIDLKVGCSWSVLPGK